MLSTCLRRRPVQPFALYQIGTPWFTHSNDASKISDLSDHVEAKGANDFGVLFVICILGVLVNLLPEVKNRVATTMEEAMLSRLGCRYPRLEGVRFARSWTKWISKSEQQWARPSSIKTTQTVVVD